MGKNEFIEFVKGQDFLGEDRKNELLENADWMTSEERGFIVTEITKTGEFIKKNSEEAFNKLLKIEQALKEFKKKELPKLVKAEEKTEHSSDEDRANKLLQQL